MAAYSARSAEASFRSTWVAEHYQACTRFVRASVALTLGLVVLILLGWACDISVLKCGIPGQRATQPLTAVCFAICALSLGVSVKPRRHYRALTRGGAALVLLIVGSIIVQNALDTDWGLDRLLFPDAVLHDQMGQYLRPGRPSAGALLALLLISLCLLLAWARRPLARRLYVWFATACALFAVAVIVAYAFSLHAVYAMGFYAHVGLMSGIGIGLLSFGVLVRRSDLGWTGILAGPGVGAVSARRMLKWTVILLLTLAAIVRMGTSVALYSAGFEVTLITLGGIGVLLYGLVLHARRLDTVDDARRVLSSELRTIETEMLQAQQQRQAWLMDLVHELRNPLAPLRNGVEIIRQRTTFDPLLGRTADMMTRQVNQLVRLVEGLPAASMESEPRRAIGEPQVGDVGAGSVAPLRLRILVVDDNVDAAASLALLLQLDGHEVLTAEDGVRAIELAEMFRPQVILMDLAMPQLDGVETARRIRALSWGGDVRIAALTAWGQESQRRRTREAGMDLHLVKPVDMRALTAFLEDSHRLSRS